MAKRPSRRVVGERVQALAYRLSDDLLGDEEDAQAAMERKFVHAIPEARGLLDDAYGLGLVKALAAGLDAQIVLVMGGVLDRTTPVFRGLVREAGEKALSSITSEMRLCERSLGDKYRGVAVEARDAAEGIVEVRMEQAIRMYRQEVDPALGGLRSEVEKDWRAAHRLGETIEQVDRRLFAPNQVGYPSHVGRGAWWKPFSRAAAVFRSQEFLMVNDLRRQVMWEFNQIGGRRG